MASTSSRQFRELSTGQFRGAGGRFIPNPVGIRLIELGPGMQAMLRAQAEEIVKAAKELASREAKETGDYRDRIRAASGVDKVDGRTTSVGRVNAFDYKSHWIEFGTVKWQPPKAILQRAAESVGLVVTAGRNVRRIFGSGRERLLRTKG